mmetsp:Transcript_42757/g.106445  ORF Transcript_42757/g.106445 Transcript_42757/m.106445 type:complete len:95 (-) Transcript_42757:671-955(-)
MLMPDELHLDSYQQKHEKLLGFVLVVKLTFLWYLNAVSLTHSRKNGRCDHFLPFDCERASFLSQFGAIDEHVANELIACRWLTHTHDRCEQFKV